MLYFTVSVGGANFSGAQGAVRHTTTAAIHWPERCVPAAAWLARQQRVCSWGWSTVEAPEVVLTVNLL